VLKKAWPGLDPGQHRLLEKIMLQQSAEAT
jgi:hypothetical protein